MKANHRLGGIGTYSVAVILTNVLFIKKYFQSHHLYQIQLHQSILSIERLSQLGQQPSLINELNSFIATYENWQKQQLQGCKNTLNAEEKEAVALTAFDGGKLRKISNYNVHIPTGKKEYGPAEDLHMILDHLIGNYLMRLVAK